MYPLIPCKLVADSFGFVEHTLGTTDINRWTIQFIHVCTKSQWYWGKLNCGSLDRARKMRTTMHVEPVQDEKLGSIKFGENLKRRDLGVDGGIP